jgi:hypothetical protein
MRWNIARISHKIIENPPAITGKGVKLTPFLSLTLNRTSLAKNYLEVFVSEL